MGVQAGRKLAIRVSLTPITSATEGVKISFNNTAGWNTAKETHDTTGHEDEFNSQIVISKSLSTSLGGSYDSADPGQILLKDNDEVYVAMFHQGIDGPGSACKFTVTTFDLNFDATGGQTFSCELQGNGKPTDINVA